MTVKELASHAGVTPDAVRYYVQIGLLHPIRNPGNGYRLFAGKDIDRLQFIRQAKSLGFTLTEVAEVFSDAETGNSPCPRVRAILQHRIEDNRRRIDELNALQAHMEQAARQWRDMDDGGQFSDHSGHSRVYNPIYRLKEARHGRCFFI